MSSLSTLPPARGRLRILIAAETFPPDINGAATFADRLAHGLAARGHDVHVVAPASTNRSESTHADGVTTHRLAARRTPFHPTFRVCLPWRAWQDVDTLVEQLAPDVVHAQAHFVVGRAGVHAAKAHGVPILATNHFMPENLLGYLRCPPRLARPAVRWAWRDLARVYTDAALVTSPTPRAVRLLAEGGFTGEALAVSCGVDIDKYRVPATAAATSPHAALGSVGTVLFVGRLDREKRVHELVRAVADLPAGRAEIVGDGCCRPRLEALARELGAVDRIRFRGFISENELREAYARCDVFCMPGIAELQSIATMEAMAAGRPIVAADAVALPHLVRHGGNGWLYRPGDVCGLSRALASLLEDRALRERFGQASTRFIAAHAIDATLDRFEHLYRRIIAPRSDVMAAAA